MTQTKSEPVKAGTVPPPPKIAPPAAAARPIVTERGIPIAVAAEGEPEAGRVILYERLTGDAARVRAMSPEPQGAGMPPEEVARVESVEIWSTPPPSSGYDFRMYSFGGALIASRSTRS